MRNKKNRNPTNRKFSTGQSISIIANRKQTKLLAKVKTNHYPRRCCKTCFLQHLLFGVSVENKRETKSQQEKEICSESKVLFGDKITYKERQHLERFTLFVFIFRESQKGSKTNKKKEKQTQKRIIQLKINKLQKKRILTK